MICTACIFRRGAGICDNMCARDAEVTFWPHMRTTGLVHLPNVSLSPTSAAYSSEQPLLRMKS